MAQKNKIAIIKITKQINRKEVNKLSVLEVSDLSKNYKDFHLTDIDFEIPGGIIAGLLGENGSGKTTIIKSILGIINPDSGNVKFMDDQFSNFKNRIGVVLENSFLCVNKTPRDVSKVLRCAYSKWDQKKYENYLAKYNINLDKSMKKLSKGMRMKIYIITALCHDAQLLILDEPMNGLDPVAKNEVIDLFYDFVSDGKKSILMATHLTYDLDNIANYLIFMHNGKILLKDYKEKIFNNYGIIKGENFQIDNRDIIYLKYGKFSKEVLIMNKQKYKGLKVEIDDVDTNSMLIFMIEGENYESDNRK